MSRDSEIFKSIMYKTAPVGVIIYSTDPDMCADLIAFIHEYPKQVEPDSSVLRMSNEQEINAVIEFLDTKG